MIEVIICDDHKAIHQLLSGWLNDYQETHATPLKLRQFYDGADLTTYLKEHGGTKLIFLDIEMNKLNGIDTGRFIRYELNDPSTQIVYMTGTTQYDRQLFEVQPLYFLAKPMTKDEFFKAVDLGVKRMGVQGATYEFSDSGEHQRLPLEEVLYFESQGRKVNIVTHRQTYSVYDRLKHVIEKMEDQPQFVQVQRSYVVNFTHVTTYRRSALTMADGLEIPIGRKFQDQVTDYYFKLHNDQ